MPDNSRRNSDRPINDPAIIVRGGETDEVTSGLSTITVHDVTDFEPVDLGDYIRQKVQNGYTCKVYPDGSRIMLSVHG